MEEVKDKNGDAVVLTQTGSYLDALGQMTISANGTITTKLVTAKDMGDITPNQDVKAIEDAWVTDINQKAGPGYRNSGTVFDNYKPRWHPFWCAAWRQTPATLPPTRCTICLTTRAWMWTSLWMNGGGITNQALTGDHLPPHTSSKCTPWQCQPVSSPSPASQLLDALEMGRSWHKYRGEMGLPPGVSASLTIDTTHCSHGSASDDKGVWTGGPTKVASTG